MNGMKKLAASLLALALTALGLHGAWVLLGNEPLVLKNESAETHNVVAWVGVGLGALGLLGGVGMLGKRMYKKKGGKKSSRGSRRR